MTSPRIQIAVFQPTSLCNLNCRYCYVPNRKDNFVMTEATLKLSIRKILQSNLVSDEVEFLWHAGEPLLAGKNFYRQAMLFIDEFNTRGLKITQSIQTNATLIDEEWCMFFKQYNFEVGVSIDGPLFLHDSQRHDWNGRGSHKRALDGFKLLQKYNIPNGAICVLTANLLKYPEDVFNFFVSEGFHSIAFNVEEIENANKKTSLNNNFLQTKQDYINFISQIYTLQQASSTKVEIREINQVYRVLAIKRHNPKYRRTPPEVLPLGILTIHKNGDLSAYSPEFAGVISDKYNNFIIGNIKDVDVDNLPSIPAFIKIKTDIDKNILKCLETCKYFDLCGGAFLSNKYSEHGNFLVAETISCNLHMQTLTDVLVEKAKKV